MNDVTLLIDLSVNHLNLVNEYPPIPFVCSLDMYCTI